MIYLVPGAMGFFLQTDSFLTTESFENVGMGGGGGGRAEEREQDDTPRGGGGGTCMGGGGGGGGWGGGGGETSNAGCTHGKTEET